MPPQAPASSFTILLLLLLHLPLFLPSLLLLLLLQHPLTYALPSLLLPTIPYALQTPAPPTCSPGDPLSAIWNAACMGSSLRALRSVLERGKNGIGKRTRMAEKDRERERRGTRKEGENREETGSKEVPAQNIRW
eukprot:768648-Hanusia_phi.AAC.3